MRKLFLVPMACLLLQGHVFAGSPAPRQLALAGHGVLTVPIPESWHDQAMPGGDGKPFSWRFTSKDGPAFEMDVSAILPPPGKAAPQASSVRQLVERAAAGLAAQSVEGTLAIKELGGAGGPGYYFSATDKAPAPGEFKRLTQGAAQVGKSVLVFTIFTNDGQDVVVRDGLLAIQKAEYSDTPVAAEQSRSELDFAQADGNIVLSVPASRLSLSLPHGGLRVTHDRSGGATESPRYFKLEDPDTGTVVSGWFEPADRYMDLDKSFAGEMDQVKGILGPAQQVERSEINGWHVITYHFALPRGGTSANIRASYTGAGTWIDLHASVSTSAPADEARRRVRALLESVHVTEKQ